MFFKRKGFLVAGLLLLLILSGCKEKTTAPNIDEQKKVIDTYFNGLKVGDKDKILQAIDPEQGLNYIQDPESLEKIIKVQKEMGSLKKWEITGTPFVSDINNQALIDVTATYPSLVYKLQFDLRKTAGQWKIYGVDTGDKKTQKNPM